MTLREMADVVGLNDDAEAIGFLMAAFQVVRSALQRDQATFEGCCASCLEWSKHYGNPTPERVRQWFDDVPRLADVEIPDTFLAECMATED